MRLWVLAGGGFLLGSCHYSEEEKWGVCCVLYITGEEKPGPSARATIIDCQRRTWFGGDGSASEVIDVGAPRDNWKSHTWKNQQVRAAIGNFLADSPGGRATDYFLSLGMTCSPVMATPGNDVTQCAIDLPIWVNCGPTYRWLPGTTPIPKELQKPIPAFLRMSVDLSASAVLATSTRIDPIPGGHLCHR
jgi:hypothetical protein